MKSVSNFLVIGGTWREEHAAFLMAVMDIDNAQIYKEDREILSEVDPDKRIALFKKCVQNCILKHKGFLIFKSETTEDFSAFMKLIQYLPYCVRYNRIRKNSYRKPRISSFTFKLKHNKYTEMFLFITLLEEILKMILAIKK